MLRAEVVNEEDGVWVPSSEISISLLDVVQFTRRDWLEPSSFAVLCHCEPS